MEREIIGILGLIILFVLLFLRVPVGQAMILIGVGGNYALSLAVPYLRFEPYLKQFKTLLWSTVADYNLSVIPLFIFMGFLTSHSKLSHDLFQGINVLVRRCRGGIAMAAIIACAGFGAVCGSSLATASTMGKVTLPELKKFHYSDKLSTGTLAAGGTLGILIPPSVVLVIYAILVEASIIKMFQAAIIPGIIAIIFFISVIAVWTYFKPELAPESIKLSSQEKKKAILKLIPIALIFVVIILGLGVGFFTPTPAAAVGASVILIYSVFLRLKDKNKSEGLSMQGLKSSCLETAKTSGMLYFILFGAEVLKTFFSRSNLPVILTSWITSSGINAWMILIVMLFILILLGCFMDSLAMILVIIPFFWPVLLDLNSVDSLATEFIFGMNDESLKIWFGIIALVVVELGLITPPVGLNVFIISSLSKGVRMGDVFMGVIPFFCMEIFRIILLLFFPFLSLFLPRLLTG